MICATVCFLRAAVSAQHTEGAGAKGHEQQCAGDYRGWLGNGSNCPAKTTRDALDVGTDEVSIRVRIIEIVLSEPGYRESELFDIRPVEAVYAAITISGFPVDHYIEVLTAGAI